MKELPQPNGLLTSDIASPPLVLDYVNALIVNKAGQALVFEVEKPGGGVYWEMMDRYLQPKEDPFTAVQQKLRQVTGCEAVNWSYLGGHATEASRLNGVGFLFCAQQARQVVVPTPAGLTPYCLKWVPLTDLRYALLDGRISVMSHALTVSLALLTLLK